MVPFARSVVQPRCGTNPCGLLGAAVGSPSVSVVHLAIVLALGEREFIARSSFGSVSTCSLDFALGDSTVAACFISILPPELLIHAHISQLHAWMQSEHNRIGQCILDQFVELFFGIYDLVSIVTVDDVDKTVRILVEMTPQWMDLVLASHAPHGKT